MHHGLPNSWWYTLVGTGDCRTDNLALGKTRAEAKEELAAFNRRRMEMGLAVIEAK